MKDTVQADDGMAEKMFCIFPDEAMTGKRNKFLVNLQQMIQNSILKNMNYFSAPGLETAQPVLI